MLHRFSLFTLAICLMLGLTSQAMAGKVPTPANGKGFAAINLAEARDLHNKGAFFVACHSHTTDYLKGHPAGTKHITCMVPKDHKRTDLPLAQVSFDVNQLPADKSSTIVMYCASGT